MGFVPHRGAVMQPCVPGPVGDFAAQTQAGHRLRMPACRQQIAQEFFAGAVMRRALGVAADPVRRLGGAGGPVIRRGEQQGSAWRKHAAKFGQQPRRFRDAIKQVQGGNKIRRAIAKRK